MRVQLRIPTTLWEHLCTLAEAEHRPPKHQAEVLLYRALQKAMNADETSERHEAALEVEEVGA